MNISFDELKHALEYLSDIKWEKGFKCSDCDSKNNFDENKKDYSRKCRDCDTISSVTAGTAFNKFRKTHLLPAIKILFDMRDRYYYEVIERPYSKSIKGEPARYSTTNIAKDFKLKQRAASRLLNHILKNLQEKRRKKNDGNERWFYNIKPENHAKYNALYQILFEDNFPRNGREILGLLLKTKPTKKTRHK